MKIIICIKPVPSTIIFPNEQGMGDYFINPYDLLPLYKITNLKKTNKNIFITCVSMGTIEAKKMLIKCLAMGCDEAVLLSDKTNFAGADTLATVNVLAKAINKIQYDCIICGNKSIDGETGQVKYGLSEKLQVECVDNVVDILKIEDNSIEFKLDKDVNYQIVRSSLPVLISFKEFTLKNEEITLLKLKRATKKPLVIWEAKDIDIETNLCGITGSKTKVSKVVSINNKHNSNCITINGNIKNKTDFIKDMIFSVRGNSLLRMNKDKY